MEEEMSSSRPYLVRAIYEWISDNNLTPYVLVNAEAPETVVPLEFVEKGKIVLNISAKAISDLHIDDEWLLFSARFNGKSMDVTVPIMSVLAIYAKENGQGMVLEQEEGNGMPPPIPGMRKTTKTEKKVVKKSHLQLVK